MFRNVRDLSHCAQNLKAATELALSTVTYNALVQCAFTNANGPYSTGDLVYDADFGQEIGVYSSAIKVCIGNL